jgi:hypothetical protein
VGIGGKEGRSPGSWMTTQPNYKPGEAFDDCLWPVSRDLSIRSLHLFP